MTWEEWITLPIREQDEAVHILILEADNGRVSDVNPFLVKLLGFSREEMVGRSVGELSPFRDVLSNKAMLARLQKDGYVRYEDLPLETSEGRHIAVEFVSNVYQSGDEKVIQCNIRDITRRKHDEAQISQLNQTLEQRVLDRTARLKSSNDELQTFNYSVSPDLRAPLRHILGVIDLLQTDPSLSLPKSASDGLSMINKSAHRMSGLIDNLLAFSRLGQADVNKSTVDLNALIRDILPDLQADTKARKITWNIPALPPGVQADPGLAPDRDEQSPFQRGEVHWLLRRGQNRNRCSLPERRKTIFIRDNGAGFDPAHAGKLFGVFQRLETPIKFEGLGIGLANVRRIIDRHGGRTWAEGVPGVGATFHFSLPS